MPAFARSKGANSLRVVKPACWVCRRHRVCRVLMSCPILPFTTECRHRSRRRISLPRQVRLLLFERAQARRCAPRAPRTRRRWRARASGVHRVVVRPAFAGHRQTRPLRRAKCHQIARARPARRAEGRDHWSSVAFDGSRYPRASALSWPPPSAGPQRVTPRLSRTPTRIPGLEMTAPGNLLHARR